MAGAGIFGFCRSLGKHLSSCLFHTRTGRFFFAITAYWLSFQIVYFFIGPYLYLGSSHFPLLRNIDGILYPFAVFLTNDYGWLLPYLLEIMVLLGLFLWVKYGTMKFFMFFMFFVFTINDFPTFVLWMKNPPPGL